MKSKITPIVILGLLLTGVFLAIPYLSKAQGNENPAGIRKESEQTMDSSTRYFSITKDNGQEIIAKIVRQDARELEIVTKDGRTIILPQYIVINIKALDAKYVQENGDYLDEDPYRSRYVITTNGLPIRKGQNYGQFTLLGPEAHFHLNDHLGVGVMTSWLGTPIIGTLKYSKSINENLHWGVGTLIGTGSCTLFQHQRHSWRVHRSGLFRFRQSCQHGCI